MIALTKIKLYYLSIYPTTIQEMNSQNQYPLHIAIIQSDNSYGMLLLFDNYYTYFLKQQLNMIVMEIIHYI